MSGEHDLEVVALRQLLAQTTQDYEEQISELLAEKELAQITLASIGDAVVTTDAEARVSYLNPVAEELSGWSNQEGTGRQLSEVLAFVDERDGSPMELDLSSCLIEGRKLFLTDQISLLRRGGKRFAIESSASAIRDRDDEIIGLVLVFQDVSEKRLLSLQLTRAANYDGLTGLLNREAFEQHLYTALQESRETDCCQALCYIDLDQFKVVNDTCGHPAGDQLLQWIASLIRERVRDSDVFARLGGDEFGLLLHNCPVDAARRIAEQIHQALREFRFIWDGNSFAIGLSVGLVPVDASFKDLAELLGAADQACYMAKQKGRRRTQVYERGDLEIRRHQGQMNWVVRLQRALDENHFQLYWQRILPLADDPKKLFFEVLLRLEDAEGRLQTPSEFLPAAERYGLMQTIDRWVVEHTMELLVSQPPNFLRSLDCCAINLSGASLGDDSMLEFIEDCLQRTGVAAEKLCFEITETAAVSNLERAIVMIERLTEQSCRWALDDFGSGMSSYSYLRELPVHFLKIDGGIVGDLLSSPLNREMVKSINQIGHVMDVRTIAESVTSESILEVLREIGVDYAQGFGIERPRPIAAREKAEQPVSIGGALNAP